MLVVAGILSLVHGRKPDAIEKQVLPALFALLDVPKTEVRAAVGTALSACARCVGKAAVIDCGGGLSEEHRTRLKGLVGGR